MFVDDATHMPRTMAYAVPASVNQPGSLTKSVVGPLDLTAGTGQLVSGQQPLVEGNVKLIDKSYALMLCNGGGICSFVGCAGRINLGAPGKGQCGGGANSCCSLGPA